MGEFIGYATGFFLSAGGCYFIALAYGVLNEAMTPRTITPEIAQKLAALDAYNRNTKSEEQLHREALDRMIKRFQ